MRKPIIAGNWKMHKTIVEGIEFVNDIKKEVEGTEIDVVLCVPYLMLSYLKTLTDGTNIKIGAQNMHYEDDGAFTGEISSQMLKSIKVDYVIIGHSERRAYYNETNQSVNKKIKKALEVGIRPILCVGETLQERESGKMNDVVKNQIVQALDGVSKEDMPSVVIAYEPIWAIGTGKTASAKDAQTMIKAIRQIIADIYDEEVSEEVQLQYGGSVKPSNIEELMQQEDIDGALVGGASLNTSDFIELVNF